MARPDWTKKVIADLNFELSTHTHGREDAVKYVHEYTDFLEEFITGLPASFFADQLYLEGVKVLSPIQIWSDDSSIAVGGIPSMISDLSVGESMGTHYHSQCGNENFYQEPAYRFRHEMYTGLVLVLDKTAAVPMNFTRPFKGATVSIDGSVCHGADANLPGLHLVSKQGIQAGEAFYNKIREIDRAHGRLLDRSEEERASLLATGCRSLNQELLCIFKKEQDYSVRLSWHDDVFLPQQVARENARTMDRAIACLGDRNLPGALEAVYTVDNNRYAFLSEEEIYTYFTEYILKQPPDRLKQGARRIVYRQNLLRLVKRLKIRAGEENPDTREECDILARTQENQLGYCSDDVRYMAPLAGKLLKTIRQAGYRASELKHNLYTNESKIQEEQIRDGRPTIIPG